MRISIVIDANCDFMQSYAVLVLDNCLDIIDGTINQTTSVHQFKAKSLFASHHLIGGSEYNKEDLSILSAYFRENINRFGVFELSRSKDTSPLEFAIKGA